MATKTYKLGKYTFSFDESIEHRFIENKFYLGVVFRIDEIEYDVIQNHAMGFRIGWCGYGSKMGVSKDIPFHKGTFHFLPKEVTVTETQ